MRKPLSLLLVPLLALAWLPAASAAPPPGAQREIAQLIAALGDSQCRFERNGRWYDAARAKAHVQRKYDWLLRRDLVTSTEQFIDRAASRSSLSGRAYHVQCPGQPEVTAAGWFHARLAAQRGLTAPPR